MATLDHAYFMGAENSRKISHNHACHVRYEVAIVRIFLILVVAAVM